MDFLDLKKVLYYSILSSSFNYNYFCSHVNKTSTYEDPRKWGTADLEDTPEPREVISLDT